MCLGCAVAAWSCSAAVSVTGPGQWSVVSPEIIRTHRMFVLSTHVKTRPPPAIYSCTSAAA